MRLARLSDNSIVASLGANRRSFGGFTRSGEVDVPNISITRPRRQGSPLVAHVQSYLELLAVALPADKLENILTKQTALSWIVNSAHVGRQPRSSSAKSTMRLAQATALAFLPGLVQTRDRAHSFPRERARTTSFAKAKHPAPTLAHRS